MIEEPLSLFTPLTVFKFVFILSMFLLGIYFIFTQGKGFQSLLSGDFYGKEGFELNKNLGEHCPNVLIQKGNVFYLFNTTRAKVPGVNPLQFNSLEEYIEFTDWQRGQGIRCPIMYLQESYDAQGNAVFKYRPSPTDTQGGLQETRITYSDMVDGMPDKYGVRDETQQPESELLSNVSRSESKLLDASRDDYPYNKGDVPAFDAKGQYQGINTPLDKMFHSDGIGSSTNPMDDNWGGVKYTQAALNKGEIIH